MFWRGPGSGCFTIGAAGRGKDSGTCVGMLTCPLPGMGRVAPLAHQMPGPAQQPSDLGERSTACCLLMQLARLAFPHPLRVSRREGEVGGRCTAGPGRWDWAPSTTCHTPRITVGVTVEGEGPPENFFPRVHSGSRQP